MLLIIFVVLFMGGETAYIDITLWNFVIIMIDVIFLGLIFYKY